MGRAGHMPTQQELANMREDLQFKETEMNKSKSTASGLAGGKNRIWKISIIWLANLSLICDEIFSMIPESEKLHQDLVKVEQLESKITQELDMLREKIDKMQEEISVFEDLDTLRNEGETRKKVWQMHIRNAYLMEYIMIVLDFTSYWLWTCVYLFSETWGW